MSERVAPNPYSPYANAIPNARHLLPSLFGLLPTPGGLAPTGCERMAVVPDEPLEDVTDLLLAGRTRELPPGLCADCVGVAAGGGLAEDFPRFAPAICRECGGHSSQGEWCALCRQDLHDEWWPTRGASGGTS